jgi:hypothetical protein
VGSNSRYRRISPVAPRPGEGPLTEPAAGAQPWLRERVLCPERTSGAGTKRHVWMTPSKQGRFGMCAAVGCGHVSGLRSRPYDRWP